MLVTTEASDRTRAEATAGAGVERRELRAGSDATGSASNAVFDSGRVNAEAVRRGIAERAGAGLETDPPAPRAAAQPAVGTACIAATRDSRPDGAVGAGTARSAARRDAEVLGASTDDATARGTTGTPAGRGTAEEPGETTDAGGGAEGDDVARVTAAAARGGNISGALRVSFAPAGTKAPELRRCAAPVRGTAGSAASTRGASCTT